MWFLRGEYIWIGEIIMANKFKRFSVCIDDNTYDILKNIAENSGKSLADVTRDLIQKGLAKDWVGENEELISNTVRQQLEIVLKPHVERLAALTSKAGHMSATAAFLNVQVIQDLVPAERRKEPIEMYEKARKRSVVYMKTKAEDWEKNIK
jgi:hypothetical protein